MHAFGPTSWAERRHEDGQLFMLELHRARIAEPSRPGAAGRLVLSTLRSLLVCIAKEASSHRMYFVSFPAAMTNKLPKRSLETGDKGMG